MSYTCGTCGQVFGFTAEWARHRHDGRPTPGGRAARACADASALPATVGAPESPSTDGVSDRRVIAETIAESERNQPT